MKLVFGFIFFSFFLSCGSEPLNEAENKNDQHNVDSTLTEEMVKVVSVDEIEQTSFIKYFNKLPSIDIRFKAECYDLEVADFSIQSDFLPEIASVLGAFKPINEVYLIVYVYAADLPLPILELYNKSGEKLKEYQLFNYGFCTDLLHDNQFSSFEVLSGNKIETKSYIIEADSIIILNCDTIDFRNEIELLKIN